MIVGGRPHPTLEPALAAVTASVCRLSLVVGAADPRQLTAAELDELLATEGHVGWTVEIEWATASGRADGRRVDVVDDLPRGIWLLEPAEGRLLLWPTTSTAVWRSLNRLLPDDDELAR